MNRKPILSAGLVLAAALAFLSPTAAAAEPALPDCRADPSACMVEIRLDRVAEGIAVSVVQGGGLSCGGASDNAAGDPIINAGQLEDVDFGTSFSCAPLASIGLANGDGCSSVVAETHTEGPASASASSSCGDLSASCSSSSGLFEADFCHQEDPGLSSGGWSCSLHIRFTPVLGSASAMCGVTYGGANDGTN